jgi:hypothetical protein
MHFKILPTLALYLEDSGVQIYSWRIATLVRISLRANAGIVSASD